MRPVASRGRSAGNARTGIVSAAHASTVAIGVSERTIKVERARVMERLGVRNLAGLVKLLIEANEPQPSVDCRPARLPSTLWSRDDLRHQGWPLR